VSEDGYIVTNAHVIEKADEITVAFNDGRKSRASIIGTDPDSDLAVIKVDMTGLTPLGFRENPIRVGDLALAIGNPFGVGQTVTQGIISATGRTGLGVNKFEDFIQTDAAINPGNSGGALVDARGELVGINTVIFSRSGGSMGIGFAIPTALVEQVMNALIKDGRVSRGWLGIEIQSQLRDPTQLETSTGVEVLHVIEQGPAAKSGLRVGDIILTIDGVEMTDANTLIQYVARKSPDTELDAQVLRNGKNKQVTILLEERPEQEPVERPVVIHDETLGGVGQPNLQDQRQEVPMMSEAERDRMREELLQLFERNGAPL
jgi:serine protease DegS